MCAKRGQRPLDLLVAIRVLLVILSLSPHRGQSHVDNFKIDVVSKGKETLKLALDIALHHEVHVTHYVVIEHKIDVNEWDKQDKKRTTLVLFWSNDESFKPKPSPLPFKMKGEALMSFVWSWLEDTFENDALGNEPDHDGSNSKGWRIFNETWGHVAGSHYGVVGVQPVWAMHGK